MAGNEHIFFSKSIKGKIIIASVLACLTLMLAWAVTKSAFNNMLSAVEKISAPNDKLRLVNELTHRIVQLSQVQKAGLLGSPSSYTSFFSETKKQLQVIDTLQTLYADDNKQAARIKSLKKLLIDHDKLFINYLKVREGLVNNKTFSGQVKLLNDLINKSAVQNDSGAVTTEKNVRTVTLIPVKSDSADTRSFLSKLFGKKKHPANVTYTTVNVELQTTHDSIAMARQDSILKGMGQTMHRLAKGQQRRSALFINKEAVLNNGDNKLIRKILALLKQVETEAVAQTALNNSAAKNLVKTSVSRLSYIILTFLVITIVLLYFILRDFRRINEYRVAVEKARDEAEYHGMAKQRFLSNMSHEIRTPLQAIIGYAELMRQHGYSRKSDVDAIHSSSGHLMQIVNEVLDYNRIISGKFTINSQVFDMAELLHDVLSSLRLQAEKKGLKLIADYTIPAGNFVQGDPFRLKQVLYNLMGNAIKFTAAGEVRLSVIANTAGKRANYVFTVSDTGIGLSEKDISRIFNEFEQVLENPNHLKGTGLGLTISKALVEAQGGSISVKSTLGAGSGFKFNIHYEYAAAPKTNVDNQAGKPKNLKYGKVWLIDDDNFILDLCSAIFDAHGIKNRCFNSPAELLNTPFDAGLKYILLDVRMPEMSGTELCKLLRQKIPVGVKIYALTAQVLPGELEPLMANGFDGVLMKPFKEQELLALLSPTVIEPITTAKVELDLTKVKKMTFGDNRQLNKILKRFAEDCIDDIAELRLGIDNYDNEKLVLLVHRIAGRTAQIGAAALAADFRMLEMDFVKDDLVDAEKINAIIQLTNRLQILVKQVTNIYLDTSTPDFVNT